MLEQNLSKVLGLIRKTGDRLIVFDQLGQAYAVMNIAEYERLLTVSQSVAGLTEEELLDKINRDIAVWKSDQNSDIDGEPQAKTGRKPNEEIFRAEKRNWSSPAWSDDEFDWDETEDEEAEEEDTYYFEKV